MFTTLQPEPTDPILGLIAAFAQDARPHKIDLGVGVYRDALGRTPVLAAVKQAETLRLAQEQTKAYLGMAGDAGFNSAIERLALGEHSAARTAGRCATVQTPGGTAALRVAAELIRRAAPQASVWLGDPTWANHAPVFRAAGVALRGYPYYDLDSHRLRFDAMLAALAQAAPGDVVVLHGCCHNPSGADPSLAQWQQLAELLRDRKLLPLVDMAYQGLGDGLDEDAAGARWLADTLDELILCTSCSKNFGLYRERIGACTLVARHRTEAEAASSVMLGAVRGMYSMPPAHGAAIVRLILASAELGKLWRYELDGMRTRLQTMRQRLAEQMVDELQDAGYGYLAEQRGMFSFLSLSPAQIELLRDEHAIYLVGSGRISIAGLNRDNMERFVHAVYAVTRCPPSAVRAPIAINARP